MTECRPVASLAREVVIEVGPGTVRGPNEARPELVSAALECIDDDLALLDDRVVAVPELWNNVMCAVAGGHADTAVLVFPTWWTASRIDRVRTATRAVAPTVVVLRRTQVLRDAVTDRRATILELAQEVIVVSHLGVDANVVPRRDDPAADAEAAVAAAGASAVVSVDVPAGVEGVELLGATIGHRLRAGGIAVTFTAEDSVRRAASATRTAASNDVGDAPQRVSRRRPRTAVLSGVMSAVVLCGGFAVRGGASDSPADDIPMTLLVEGRVGVMVPAVWRVQRITAGPGSARVQIVSPSDTDVVLNLTQSPGAPESTLAVTAESLRAALEAEPDGIFVDFNPSGRRAGRPAVTYREIRPDHHVAWAVVVDDAIRIAIGCQSAPGREQLVRDPCDEAVRSAHAIF
jgi:type VII secretion-associated protein (TIGR03931 family)